MDINQLKEKLDDETFESLEQYLSDLQGQRDQARSESISGRKQMKERLGELERQQKNLMDRFGVESLDELDEIPDAKQVGETQKQFEIRMKRLEKEREELSKARDEIEIKYRSTLQKAAVGDALSKHDFVARDLVENYVQSRIMWDGDEALFQSDDGKVMPLSDGVASLAASRPELLKPVGTGGAGVRSSNARGVETADSITRADFMALDPTKRMDVVREGIKIID